ncbi:MAG: TIGR04222 domain-containing membrane protein [Erythrobacter sp.]|uniref:TIGR04222 domain-containing membrane protein n=1 Tax=Erythrobacter sp. TaxID=1042 RepID=UPI0025D38C95|nr:TIGR04222 domain-containing membrane protein [Erythrobacter sp.]MCL9998442.1 TIGR04222 domain-containing membrane protein [Erythrobacter sp.]
MELFSSWTGSDFLLFYSVLLGFAGASAWWIPNLLRDSGRRGNLDDVESIAVLAGGRKRLADSLLAELFVHGALGEGEKGKLAITHRNVAVSPAARALLEAGEPLSLADARTALAAHAERVAAKLQRAGLLMRDTEFARLRWLAITPLAALFLLGLYRQRVGDAVGEPTGFLVMLLILTFAIAVVRFVTVDPRTAAGAAAVHDLRERNGRFSRAPMPDEAAMAVALFGTAVLVGTPWEPVHAMRKPEGDGGSGCGGSSSDGGSGCGGGGCGGCGG